MTHEEYGWHQLLGEIRRERLKLAYLTETCARCRDDLACRDAARIHLTQMYPPDHDTDCPIGLAQGIHSQALRKRQEIMDAKTVARYRKPVRGHRFRRCARCGVRHASAWLRARTPPCEEKEIRRGE